MTEPADPSLALPDEVPVEIRDFVACRSDSLTLTDGDLGWLTGIASDGARSVIPGGLKPSLSIQPGPSTGTAILKVSVGWIFSVSIPASVVDGRLVVETAGLPGPQAVKDDVQAGIRTVNDWFARNGRQLGPPTIAKGSITLTKIDRPKP